MAKLCGGLSAGLSKPHAISHNDQYCVIVNRLLALKRFESFDNNTIAYEALVAQRAVEPLSGASSAGIEDELSDVRDLAAALLHVAGL